MGGLMAYLLSVGDWSSAVTVFIIILIMDNNGGNNVS
jgi:hypothetical protein